MRTECEQVLELHPSLQHEEPVQQREEPREQAVDLHRDGKPGADEPALAEVTLVDRLGASVEHSDHGARPLGRLLGEEFLGHHHRHIRRDERAHILIVDVGVRGLVQVDPDSVAANVHADAIERLVRDAPLEGVSQLVGQVGASQITPGSARHRTLIVSVREVRDEGADDVLAGPTELCVQLGRSGERLVVDAPHTVVEVEVLALLLTVSCHVRDDQDDVRVLVARLDDPLDELFADVPADRNNRLHLPFRVGFDDQVQTDGLFDSSCQCVLIS